MLEMEIIEPRIDANAQSTWCVIWLHGLGADGHDFVPIVPELHLPESVPVRFIFPHAPMQPVTINGGYVMRAWYDIVEQDLRERQDAAGTQQSQQYIIEIIEQQLALGIDSSHIILAGFSQGGAIALYTGLRFAKPLGGIMALSTYLPLAATTEAEIHAVNRKIPIFMAHGLFDTVVPLKAGVMSRRHLEQLGYRVQWQEYPMQHSVCVEEIADISAWLQGRFGNRS